MLGRKVDERLIWLRLSSTILEGDFCDSPSPGSFSFSATIRSYIKKMHLITRLYDSVQTGMCLSTVDVSNIFVTYIYFISKRSATIFGTSHTFPKEIYRIWIHVVVFLPLQHVKTLVYFEVYIKVCIK
jgi:hypothetical protein